jgi:hypothetical protein
MLAVSSLSFIQEASTSIASDIRVYKCSLVSDTSSYMCSLVGEIHGHTHRDSGLQPQAQYIRACIQKKAEHVRMFHHHRCCLSKPMCTIATQASSSTKIMPHCCSKHLCNESFASCVSVNCEECCVCEACLNCTVYCLCV